MSHLPKTLHKLKVKKTTFFFPEPQIFIYFFLNMTLNASQSADRMFFFKETPTVLLEDIS